MLKDKTSDFVLQRWVLELFASLFKTLLGKILVISNLCVSLYMGCRFPNSVCSFSVKNDDARTSHSLILLKGNGSKWRKGCWLVTLLCHQGNNQSEAKPSRLNGAADEPESAEAEAKGQAWEVNKNNLNRIDCTCTKLPRAGGRKMVISVKVIMMIMRIVQCKRGNAYGVWLLMCFVLCLSLPCLIKKKILLNLGQKMSN